MPEKEIITIKNNNIDEIEKLQNKSIAQKNSEVLVDILETLEGLTDLMKDIHLNNIKIYQYVKEQEEIKTERADYESARTAEGVSTPTEPIKGSWFY